MGQPKFFLIAFFLLFISLCLIACSKSTIPALAQKEISMISITTNNHKNYFFVPNEPLFTEMVQSLKDLTLTYKPNNVSEEKLIINIEGGIESEEVLQGELHGQLFYIEEQWYKAKQLSQYINQALDGFSKPQKITDWRMMESDHYIVHYRNGSPAESDIQDIVQNFEKGYEKIKDTLNIEITRKINVYLYKSLREGFLDTGFYTMGRADYQHFEIYQVYYGNSDRNIYTHESVHIAVMNDWGARGSNVGILAEGIPVFMEGEWHGELHEDYVKSLIQMGQYIPITDLSSREFFGKIYFDPLKSHIAEAESGSFVEYLVEKYGIEKLKELYVTTLSSMFPEYFHDIYGASLEEVQKDWINSLSD